MQVSILEDAIAVARIQIRNMKRRRQVEIVRYRAQPGGQGTRPVQRFVTMTTLNGAMNRTKIGETPLLFVSVMPDGSILGRCQEADRVLSRDRIA